MKMEEFIHVITKNVKDYYGLGVLKSVVINSHMNNYNGEEVSDETIKAILVDFVNYIMRQQVVDLAMYTKDIEGCQ